MIRNVNDMISSTSAQNSSAAESNFRNRFPHRNFFSNPTSQTSSIKEIPLPSVSYIFGDDEERLTEEVINMIMEVDAKIDHDNMLNALRQSAAEAIVHREEEHF